MTFSEEDLPLKQKKRLNPPLLDDWGVDELTLYITELESEINRARQAITAKRAHAAAASLFFKPPSGL